MTPTVRVRKRRKRPKTPLIHRRWWIGTLFFCMVATSVLLFLLPILRRQAPVEGYLSDFNVLQNEYRRFYGKVLEKPEVAQQFHRATDLMRRRELTFAVGLLEGILDTASVPLVYNNIGVLYAAMSDRVRSANAFREALAIDASYSPVLSNMNRLKSVIAVTTGPASRESEVNDSLRQANLVAVDTALSARISEGKGDVDCFKIITPPAPRDIVAIELAPANTLGAALRIYDIEFHLMDSTKMPEKEGEPLTYLFHQAPNTTLYLQVFGVRGTGGAYTLKVRANKAYDRYEPDDDIFSPRRIEMGALVEAGIMDGDDTDFYSFIARRTGSVTVELRNPGATLVPALAVFDAGRRSTGTVSDIQKPGESLRHTFTATEGQVYILRVSGQRESSGDYVLTVN